MKRHHLAQCEHEGHVLVRCKRGTVERAYRTDIDTAASTLQAVRRPLRMDTPVDTAMLLSCKLHP